MMSKMIIDIKSSDWKREDISVVVSNNFWEQLFSDFDESIDNIVNETIDKLEDYKSTFITKPKPVLRKNEMLNKQLQEAARRQSLSNYHSNLGQLQGMAYPSLSGSLGALGSCFL